VTLGDGTTYYVSPSGSDSAAGTKAAPWQTIQHAGTTVQAGDTVIVEAGTYAGVIFGWDTPPCSDDKYCTVAGTAQEPIVFEADPGAAAGSVIIGGRNNETANGFDLEPGCDYVDIVGFTITNTGSGGITKAGIAVNNSQGNIISGNTVNGVSGIGAIFVNTLTDAVIAGNTCINTQGSDTTGHGMYVSGSSSNVQVINNLIYDNAYVGLHVNGDVSEGLPGVATNGINADGLQSSTIANNVIYGNARNGIEMYQDDAFGGSTGNVIVNNTIDQSSAGYAIEIAVCNYDNQSSQPTPADCNGAGDSSTGNVAFNNVLLGKSGVDSLVASDDLTLSNNLTASSASLFVASATGNYALAAGGGGIGTGVASFDSKMAPEAGSGYDIGAFAFGLP
jgi:parallel beta-helix repeat protein